MTVACKVGPYLCDSSGLAFQTWLRQSALLDWVLKPKDSGASEWARFWNLICFPSSSKISICYNSGVLVLPLCPLSYTPSAVCILKSSMKLDQLKQAHLFIGHQCVLGMLVNRLTASIPSVYVVSAHTLEVLAWGFDPRQRNKPFIPLRGRK